MSDYSGISASTPIVAMFDSKKGDFSNRLSCAGEQAKNRFIAGAKGAAIGVGIVGAYKYAKVNPQTVKKAGDWLNKAANFLAAKLPKKVQDTQILKKVLKSSGKTKLIALAASALIGLVSKTAEEHSFRAGQIDQKYNDIAKIKEHQSNVLA